MKAALRKIASKPRQKLNYCSACKCENGSNPDCARCEKFNQLSVTDDIRVRFGMRVRYLREKQRMTQTQMSERHGLARSYLSDVERGSISIKLPMMEVIALSLRVSLEELFKDI